MPTKKAVKTEFMPPSASSLYRKSTAFINASYKSTIMENKIIACALAHADQFEISENENESIYSRIRVSELKRLLGGNDGSFYAMLEQTARAMTGKTVGMRSEDGKQFAFYSIIISCSSINGQFCIEWNHSFRRNLLELKRNYARLDLRIVASFKHNSSFRLYEIIKSKCYHLKGSREEDNVFYIQFGLSELKFQLGCIDVSEPKVKKILEGANPDFEKAAKTATKATHANWYEFRRKILDPACKEITEKSDIVLEYEPLKGGRGAGVYAIHFKATLKESEKTNDVEEPAATAEDSLIAINELLGDEFSFRDVIAIAKASGYSTAKVKKAVDCLNAMNQPVSNPTGFIISAIKQDFEPALKKAGSYNNIMENDYDMDAIMKQVIAN